MQKLDYKKTLEDFYQKCERLRYDILSYEISMTFDDFMTNEENGTNYFEKYCDDICDSVVWTALDLNNAMSAFRHLYRWTRKPCGLDIDFDSEEIVIVTVYVLCKVENNDICTVIDYSK